MNLFAECRLSEVIKVLASSRCLTILNDYRKRQQHNSIILSFTFATGLAAVRASTRVVLVKRDWVKGSATLVTRLSPRTFSKGHFAVRTGNNPFTTGGRIFD